MKKIDMTKGSIVKSVLLFALPIILGKSMYSEDDAILCDGKHRQKHAGIKKLKKNFVTH